MVFHFSKNDSRLASSQNLENGVPKKRFPEGVLFFCELPKKIVSSSLSSKQICILF